MTMTVEVFSVPACTNCAQVKVALRSIVEELGQDKVTWRDVDIIKEMDYAVELGLMSSGGIAIDGELVFPRMPSADKLREELARRLAAKSASGGTRRSAPL